MRSMTAVLLLALATSCSREVEFAPPPPPEVTVAGPLQQEITPTADFIGRTDALIVEIRARVKGYLLAAHFQQSEMVNEGDLLFTIEPDVYKANVDAAAAEVAVKEANLELANATLQRMEKALESNAVSVLDVLQARAEKSVALAQVDRSKAELEDARIDLSYTEMHAPITGRISRSLVDPGNLVGATDATLLTTIVAEDPMEVVFNVDERTLAEALERRPRADSRRDELRECMLELAGGRVYGPRGVVHFADNVVDEETGTLEIRALFPNPDGLLVSGMFGRVRIIQDPVEAILVPETALQRDLAGHYLMVVDDGKAMRRNVDVGIDYGKMNVIEKGLDGTELVIVNGLQRARDGLPVDPTERSMEMKGYADPTDLSALDEGDIVGLESDDDTAGSDEETSDG